MHSIEKEISHTHYTQPQSIAILKAWVTPQLSIINLIDQTKGGSNANAESNVGSPGAFS